MLLYRARHHSEHLVIKGVSEKLESHAEIGAITDTLLQTTTNSVMNLLYIYIYVKQIIYIYKAHIYIGLKASSLQYFSYIDKRHEDMT